MMDEVDGIILRRLSEIGCDLPEETKSIKALSQADFVDAIVRCLRLINPDVSLGASKLPSNVAARFRFATSLAEAVTALGYKGNIGYQMILYGNEADIRRLLMFLVEKLPKEGVVSTALVTTISGLDFTKRAASERLRQELKAPSAPWFCKSQESELRGLFWRQPYSAGDTTFQADGFSLERDLPTNLRSFDHVLPSVLALNGILFSSNMIKNVPTGMHEDIGLVLHAQNVGASMAKAVGSGTAKRIKPALMPKPTSLAKPAAEIASETKNEEEMRKAAAEELQKRTESLTSEVNSMEQEFEQKLSQLARLEEVLAKIRTSYQKNEEMLPAKQADINQRRLVVDLAPNVDEHIKQLQDYISKSEMRLDKLAATRDELCSPLHQEIAEIKQTSLTKPESERLLDEISASERKAVETTEEMQAKKTQLQALQREYDKMEKDINRAHYTKRILEIVANVNKQKQDIARVLDEIRGAQRDINMLSGKLDRSFTAGDELLYKDATRDDFIKRAYKCFVSLHEYCANIVSHIENAGHLEREMRDLDDQIDTESQRSVDTTLESLVNDFCEMKQANETLFAKLKELGINV